MMQKTLKKSPSRKNLTPTEYEEAIVLVEWMRAKNLRFAHVANEGRIPIQYRMKLKKVGLSSGFPDYVVFVKKGVLFIELKRIKGGKPSPAQIEWGEAINRTPGTEFYICYGAEEAIAIIASFI